MRRPGPRGARCPTAPRSSLGRIRRPGAPGGRGGRDIPFHSNIRMVASSRSRPADESRMEWMRRRSVSGALDRPASARSRASAAALRRTVTAAPSAVPARAASRRRSAGSSPSGSGRRRRRDLVGGLQHGRGHDAPGADRAGRQEGPQHLGRQGHRVRARAPAEESWHPRADVIIMAGSVARARPRRRTAGVSDGACTARTPRRSAPSTRGTQAVMPPDSDSATRRDWVRQAQPASESSTSRGGAMSPSGTSRRCWMSARETTECFRPRASVQRAPGPRAPGACRVCRPAVSHRGARGARRQGRTDDSPWADRATAAGV
ncbi:hypothetical protein QF034_007251 [Streptomyces africanus]|uniref:Uncharacterized protein n=1 Tax=Streptomyces africanus TaxID=231024 RepID=A0ABU0R033_9ACTN|nr:hypothetical protein [Streptomyces africanus]